MPSEEWFRRIHERLLAEDPTAPAELADAVWPTLVDKLGKGSPRLRGSGLVEDAATDALFGYIKQPGKFDPKKRGLLGFLVMAAEGDLRNALAKVKRRQLREVLLEDVEDPRLAGNKDLDGRALDSALDLEKVRKSLDELFPDEADRQAVQLMLDGERSTEAYAQVWGLQTLSAEEQRREVKRNKDRVNKRLQRLGVSIRERQG
jgi:RNA polymerase sigma-70 factor (ECF subfamily)